jgi:hypothetical protein
MHAVTHRGHPAGCEHFYVGAVVGEHFKGSAGVELRQDLCEATVRATARCSLRLRVFRRRARDPRSSAPKTIPPTHSVAIARARDRAASPLRCIACITLHCLLENIDHDPEHGFKCLPNTMLFAQKIGRKSDQGAGSVDVLEMLARKIVADELSRAVKSTRIDADSVAA